MSTAKELAKEEVEKKINPNKWRNRFMFLFFSIFGFLLVSFTSIFFPETWAPVIKNAVSTWGIPAIILYGAPAMAFLAGAHSKDEYDETLGAVSRVFLSLAAAAGIMSAFSYILATGIVGTGGSLLWTNPIFIMLSGWLFAFDIVFGVCLSMHLIPKQWAWLFEKLGYVAHPPPPHADRIFNKMRLYMSYEYKTELAEALLEGKDKPPPPKKVKKEEKTDEELQSISEEAIENLREASARIEGAAKEGGG